MTGLNRRGSTLLIAAMTLIMLIAQAVSSPPAYADHRSVNCLAAYTAAVQNGQTVDEHNNCPIELVNADPARFSQADKDARHHPSMCNPDPSLCIALGITAAVIAVGGAVLIGAILLGLADNDPLPNQTVPVTPTCIPPQVLFQGVCETPTPGDGGNCPTTSLRAQVAAPLGRSGLAGFPELLRPVLLFDPCDPF